ncbi:MAG TPA: hypothetical protein DEV93_23665 [Chloroflexi bacterium]|jgi:hypothetical protein|nr:hypothetical protein [Chloroflexota bacterium]
MRVLNMRAVVGRVNPLVPTVVIVSGAIVFAFGLRWIGAGMAVGALLAFANGIMLSRRVELAADTGDLGRALLVMQVGLLLTATVIGLVTVVLVRFSLAMAVASAAGFVVTQMAILGAFYFSYARTVGVEKAA